MSTVIPTNSPTLVPLDKDNPPESVRKEKAEHDLAVLGGIAFGGLGQRSLNRPSVLESARNGSAVHIEPSSPFVYTEGFTPKRKKAADAAIALLFFARCPLAVLWRVAFVIVNAFNRVFWRRLLSHISKKIGRIFPPIANGDTAPAILSIGAAFGVRASLNYV